VRLPTLFHLPLLLYIYRAVIVVLHSIASRYAVIFVLLLAPVDVAARLDGHADCDDVDSSAAFTINFNLITLTLR
jgi:hypothetical protein